MRFIALMLFAGCTISTATTSEDLSAGERAWLDDALPVFQTSCISCHDQPEHGFAFLAGSSAFHIRLTLLDSEVGDLSIAPPNSPLLTKGVHAGPALTASQAAAIFRWLEAERGWQ